MSSKQSNSGASTSKKIRMTMACERCRSKKVKCDFAHPQCARCQQAKAQCSYDGSATQVDLFNLVKLNETVDILQKRVQSIETDIKDVCSNTQYVANEVRMNRAAGGKDIIQEVEPQEDSVTNNKPSSTSSRINKIPTTTTIQRSPTNNNNLMNGLMATSNAQWSLSLTPKGLRIDTNIISLHDLYDILLSGVSQFDLSGNHGGSCSSSLHHDTLESSSQSSSSITAPESPRPDTATVLKKKPLWKSRLKTFPLYSSWEPEQRNNSKNNNNNQMQYNNESSKQMMQDELTEETMQHMVKIFCECFLCLPCPDPANSIAERYKKGTLDPLLANSVFAWTARHAAIYHNLFSGKDPNQVGKPFFLKAKSLVKERFMKTSVDTMHSLIIMYIYAIGIPSEHKAEVESEAYIYLGLAIRMCLDLKMHQESKSENPYDRERHRRFFWVTYFLETLGSIHSDKPFSLPPKNMITVNFPTVMEHEQSGESRYRVEFMIQRFKITRIYRNIIYKTAEEKPLLSQISAIDKELENWHAALPSYLKYKPGDIHKRRWDTTSFKEQACIKLNFEYNFQLCQLYGLFFSKSGTEDDAEQPSTIEVLSRDICLKAARNTVELLECWVQLKQLWCHFSLENLMMITMIYGNILSQPNDSERGIAKTNLEKMARILLSAPVRHHKYVLTLVNRIKAIFLETLQTNLVIDTKALVQQDQNKTTEQQQQQQSTIDTTSIIPTTITLSSNTTTTTTTMDNNSTPPPHQAPPPTSNIPPTSIQQNTATANIQPISLTNQFTQRNPIFNVLDVASASSAFDMHKTDAFSEEMHFSDFVYTPTLLDYGTATNHTGLLSTVMEITSYHHGKKPDYSAAATSSPYMQQQQQRYSPPQHYNSNTFGYNNDTPSTNHSVTPPPHHHFHPQQNTSPIPWIGMETSTSATTSNNTAPIMLNNPLDEQRHPHPYLRMPAYNERQQQPLKSTPPPPTQPPQQQSQSGTIPTTKNYYNNDNTTNNYGGPPYY